jgi:hypothetical protein
MTVPAGFSRDIVKLRYALFTPSDSVSGALPDWPEGVINIVISSVHRLSL